MYKGKLVFAQLTEFLSNHEFQKCVNRYKGNAYVKSFSCWDQFLCMTFAQLTYRESLRDIETCLRSFKSNLYHMGIRGNVSRSTLAEANERRDWRIYADFAQVLIHEARLLYQGEKFGVELKETVYALDATTIDLCLSLFPWAKFRKQKGAVKLHTLLDVRGQIPVFINITDGKVHDVNVLDFLVLEAGSIYLMDRGYMDYDRLYQLHQERAYFVIRAKKNTKYERVYSRPVDKSTGLRCDQTVRFTAPDAAKAYPDHLRRVGYVDLETGERYDYLSNHFTVPALAIADLYRCRWKVELFFKWIKQHLRIQNFYGTTANAVKTQIWIAISVYVLVAIVKKRLGIKQSLYTLLQILNMTLFDKRRLDEIIQDSETIEQAMNNDSQMNLFDS